MKFFETLNGQFFNVENIKRIYHSDTGESLYSYVELKDGHTTDFLEVPNVVQNAEGLDEPFDSDELISWHRYAILYLLNSEDPLITSEELNEKSWISFKRSIKRTPKETLCTL